jgi:aryl-alcohol dehydrogenase-like predicted oxidoreductase
MNMFGQRGVSKIDSQWQENFFEILSIYDGLIKEGKIKHIGVSNENPYGVMKFISESYNHNLPRIVSIQNPYSLLNRLFEVGLSEICLRESVGLLAYSPLAFSFLTGKHLNGIQPNSRLGLFPQFTRYSSENCRKATQLYNQLALDNGLTLTQMALAFVKQQEFVSSTIIGATSIKQLQENIAAFEVVLSPEVLAGINKIQAVYPDPAP